MTKEEKFKDLVFLIENYNNDYFCKTTDYNYNFDYNRKRIMKIFNNINKMFNNTKIKYGNKYLLINDLSLTFNENMRYFSFCFINYYEITPYRLMKPRHYERLLPIEIKKEFKIISLADLRKEFKTRLKFLSQKTPGDLYIIKNEVGRYKIGKSKDVNNRIKIIESHGGIKAELIKRIENADFLEFKIHELFKDKRYHGEWFNLNKEDLNFLLTENLFDFFKKYK